MNWRFWAIAFAIGIYLSDAQAQWVQTGFQPELDPRCIAAEGGVFFSASGGTGWTRISSGLPAGMKVSSVIAVPNGTSLGIALLAVYDMLGSEVAILVDEKQEPGRDTIRWDGSKLPAGFICTG
jgi:hypothetical protein